MRAARLIARWLGVSLLGVVALVTLAVLAAIALLSLESTRDRIRTELERGLTSALGEPVRIRALSWLSPAGVALDGLAVGEEKPALRVSSLRVRLTLPRLVPPRLAARVELVAPRLLLVRDDDGVWNVERWGGGSSPDDGTGVEIPRWVAEVGARIEDGQVSVRGLSTQPLRWSEVGLEGRIWVGLLRDSVVEIDRLSARLGERSRLDLYGTYELEGRNRLHARLRLERLVGADLGGLVPALRPAVELAGVVDVQGTVAAPELSVELASGSATLDVSGRLSTGPTGTRLADLRVGARSVDPAALFEEAAPGELTGRLDGSLSLLGDEVRGVDGRLELTGSRWAGVALRSLAVEARTEGAEVAVEADVTGSDESVHASARGRVQLAAPHAVHLAGELGLRDRGSRTGSLARYLAGTELDAKLEAEIPEPLAHEPSGALVVRVAPGRMRGIPVDGAELRASLGGNVLRVDRFWVGADQTDLEGSLRMELGGAPAARVLRGEVRGPVSLGLFADAFGVIETDLRLEGSLADLGLSASITSVGPVEMPGLDGRFSARIEGAGLGGEEASARLALEGAIEPRSPWARIVGREERPVDLRLAWSREPAGGSGPPRDHFDLEARLGSEGPGAVVNAQLEARGDDGEIELRAAELRPIVGPPWTFSPGARVSRRAGAVDFQALEVAVGEGWIRAGGRLAGSPAERSDLEVRATAIDLGPLCALLMVGDGCRGRLRAALEVEGDGPRPDLDLDLRADDLVVADQRYGVLALRAETRGAKLLVGGRLGEPSVGALRIDGELPLQKAAPWPSTIDPARLDLRADGVPIDALRGLAGGALRRLAGRATARLELRGPLADPRLSGELEVDGLEIAPAATGVTHRDGRLRLAADSSRIRLQELALDGGAIEAGGHVALVAGRADRLDLWAALDEAAVVRRPEADATASGRLVLTGTVAAPRLDGEITIDRATIRPAVAPGSGAPEPDPSVIVVRGDEPAPRWISGIPPELGGEMASRPIRRAPAAGASQESAAPDLYEGLSMMVTVRLGDPVVVRRYDANLRLQGEVYVTKIPADDLRITGGIGGRQGWYVFQGRRFEIRSVWVTFTGETPLDPYLNVEARYRAGDYRIWIRITGTAAHPNLDLSSEPPLEESDVLSVILFGKPASQLDDAQGRALQSQAFALLASYVAPELQRSVLDTFGLASLTFSMPSGDTAGTIGIGRYFGEDLFVSVARDFGGPSGGTNRQLQGLVGSSVTLQYYLTPSVTLQGASSTEGESSVDVIWQRRY